MPSLLTDGVGIHAQKKCAPSCARKDIFLALLKHHQQKAIWLLITGDLSKFDPLIGDTSCEMRPPFLVDMYWKIQAYLKKKNGLQNALVIANEYQIAHQNEVDSRKIRTLADLENKNHPKAYDDLYAELVNVLGDAYVKLIGLCYSLTVSNFHARDEFGSIFYFTSMGLFTEDELPMLRHDLATACIDYFRNVIVKTLGSCELEEAAQKMVSFIPQQKPGIDDIPVIAAHTQFHAILRYQYRLGRPVVVMVRRLEIDCSKPDGLTYTLKDARGLFYVPDNQGAYVLSQDITPGQEKEPCMVFSCWNTYHKGESGPGLNAADNIQYYESLSKYDISWLITTMAAVHQPYPNRSSAACNKHSVAYGKINGERLRSFEYSRAACTGFDLNQHNPKTHPSLYEESYIAEQLASEGFSFMGAKLLPIGVRPGQCYSRTSVAVDFTAEHVRILSYKQVRHFCKYLMGRHALSSQSVGQHVVRIGENGISCIDKVFADELTSVRSTTRRKASYLENYGGNRTFLTPLEFPYT